MTEVIGVKFKDGGKVYFFDPAGIQVTRGAEVIVETSRGVEFGSCADANMEVPDEQVTQPLRPLVRLATDADRQTLAINKEKEKRAFDVCLKKIEEHGLDMKLIEVEYSFDGSKILFFFTSDGRVDFRELVKALAGIFKTRIELRQIGVRDEAKLLGGLGICGKPFCCATFLDDFQPVSIKMAKTQSLSLNPTKISGTCGRLMCCLKYEQDAYESLLKETPKQDSTVLTPDGLGRVTDVSLLRGMLKVRLENGGEMNTPQLYHNSEVSPLDKEGNPTRPIERRVQKHEPEYAMPEVRFRSDKGDAAPAPSAENEADAPKFEKKPRRNNNRPGQRRKEPAKPGEPDALKKEPAKPEAAKREPAKDAPRPDAAKREPQKDAPRKDAPRPQQPKKEYPKKEYPPRDNQRRDAPKKDIPKKEPPKTDAAPIEAADAAAKDAPKKKRFYGKNRHYPRKKPGTGEGGHGGGEQ